jgi:anthranilate synthase/aminodeoxychorismate synthase-like glutamine amidotransferase
MILVLDHYDSFVYNLVQMVESAGFECRVVRSDAAVAEELAALEPDGIILSPGPGRPEDAGCMVELVHRLPEATPVLGVCLGHQALGLAFGGRVARAPVPVHGKSSPVRHRGEGILAGVPSPFEAGRYHSLAVLAEELPPEVEVVGWTGDGVVMALRHRSLPRFGLQFHPESILTPEGPRIMANFLALVADGASRSVGGGYGTAAGSTLMAEGRRAASSE